MTSSSIGQQLKQTLQYLVNREVDGDTFDETTTMFDSTTTTFDKV